jgi:hypothetical protein
MVLWQLQIQQQTQLQVQQQTQLQIQQQTQLQVQLPRLWHHRVLHAQVLWNPRAQGQQSAAQVPVSAKRAC